MNIQQKVNIFFQDVWAEMKRVSWLSNKDVFKYTMIVLIVTIATAAFLGGLDFIFSLGIKQIILRAF